MEPSPPVVAKKLWKILRIVFLMLRKRISKSKILLELHHLMTKRGKILEKVIENLMFHHHSATHSSFIGPKELESSCSNSPAFSFHLGSSSNKRNSRRHESAVRKMLEMLSAEASPVLPGFEQSPMMVRQLRITDSPFPISDNENSIEVDEQAEEFIKRFYTQLRLQSFLSPCETPTRE
ncbi:hypothetical protein ACHQM5_002043 [Ranunculus cassubicifolius]